MSELKVRFIDDTYVEYYNTGKHDLAQIYLKSEADKVIAELKDKLRHYPMMAALIESGNKVIAELKAREDVLVTDNRNLLDKVKMLENLLRENADHFKRNEAQILENAENELRRHKHKRCLAMARWSFTKSNYHYVLSRHGEDAKKNNRKSVLYSKWHKRWLELAEMFK